MTEGFPVPLSQVALVEPGRGSVPRQQLGGRGPAEVVGEKGYHSNATLAALGIRSYVSEPGRGRRQWRDKPAARAAVYANRRRIRGVRGRRLLRQRGERLERPHGRVRALLDTLITVLSRFWRLVTSARTLTPSDLSDPSWIDPNDTVSSICSVRATRKGFCHGLLVSPPALVAARARNAPA